eukprot:UN12893
MKTLLLLVFVVNVYSTDTRYYEVLLERYKPLKQRAVEGDLYDEPGHYRYDR